MPAAGEVDVAERARALLARGRPVLLVGPAGIGKTTATADVIDGRQHLAAQCLPAFTSMPYRALSHAVSAPLLGMPSAVATELAGAVADRLLVVEDLHWADEPTLEVVAELVGRVPMLLTSRPPAPAPIGTDPRIVTVHVEPLTPAQAADLARRLHPSLSDADRTVLVEAAGGNPLMLRHLAHDGLVSPTFETALTDRARHLPPAVLDGIGRLALHGRPARPGVLGIPTAGESDGVLVDGHAGHVWFVHERFAAVIPSVLGEQRVRALRHELAQASEPADAARHHLELGNLTEAARLAQLGAEGADPATRAFLLTVAADALGADAPCELLLRAADAMITAHRPADARRFAGAVTGDDATMAAAGLQLARAQWLDGDSTGAERHLDRALGLVAGSGSALEAQLIVERAAVAVRTRVGDPAIVQIADDAVDASERTGVDRARALNAAGLARSHTGQPGWASYFEEAERIAAADGDIEEECAAAFWLVSALGFYGPMVKAIELGARMTERTARLGLRRWHHHFLTAHVLHLQSRGEVPDDRLDDCRRLLRDEPLFRNRAQVELALAGALADRCRLDEAQAVVDEGFRRARNDEDRATLCSARCELALAARDRPMMDAALADLARLSSAFFGFNALAESAAIHLALANADRVDLPDPARSLTPVLDVVAIERDAYDLHLQGRAAAAIDAMQRAADEWERRALLRFARRARCGVVEIAFAAGELDIALALLDRAAPPATGSDDVSARRQAELRRSVARAVVSRTLTTREIEVFVLVAAGLTTRQIAKRLGIAATTVDSHIAAAMRQLGCRTRRQAAAIVVA